MSRTLADACSVHESAGPSRIVETQSGRCHATRKTTSPPDCDDNRVGVIQSRQCAQRTSLPATRSHKRSGLLARECANYQESSAMKIAMNNCSIANVSRKRACSITTSNNCMFDRDGARDERSNDRPQQRSRSTIAWSIATRIAINDCQPSHD